MKNKGHLTFLDPSKIELIFYRDSWSTHFAWNSNTAVYLSLCTHVQGKTWPTVCNGLIRGFVDYSKNGEQKHRPHPSILG